MPNSTQAKSNGKPSPPGSKGDFIRAQVRAGKSVAETIAEGKRAGLKLATSLIYNIRSEMKLGKKKAKKTGKKTPAMHASKAAAQRAGKAAAQRAGKAAAQRAGKVSARHPRPSTSTPARTPHTARSPEAAALASQLHGLALQVGLPQLEAIVGQALDDLKRQVTAAS